MGELQYYISMGTAMDITCYNNRTPLQATSRVGFVDVARWLLELLDHGADADSQQDDHYTPINSAAAIGCLEPV